MTKDEALALRHGDMVHHVTRKNADGSPMRAKVTSIQVWKHSGRVEVRVKRGLHEFSIFTEDELGQIEKGYK